MIGRIWHCKNLFFDELYFNQNFWLVFRWSSPAALEMLAVMPKVLRSRRLQFLEIIFDFELTMAQSYWQVSDTKRRQTLNLTVFVRICQNMIWFIS